MSKTTKYGDWAIGLSASVIPSMYLVGMALGQILKHYNPSNVDINSGLAYLQQVILSSFIAGGLVVAAAVACAVMARQGGDSDKSELAIKILLSQLAVLATLVALRYILPTA